MADIFLGTGLFGAIMLCMLVMAYHAGRMSVHVDNLLKHIEEKKSV